MAAPTTTATAKAETITLRHLAETLSGSHELPKKQVLGILDDMVGSITKHLKKGVRVRISGLGILQVRKRPARMGRNPATGEQIKIKASKKVAFRAAKELKEAV
jgi:DNA-binding protein HU-beta